MRDLIRNLFAEEIAECRAEGFAEGRNKLLKTMLSKKKYTINEIADMTDITVEELEKIAESLFGTLPQDVSLEEAKSERLEKI